MNKIVHFVSALLFSISTFSQKDGFWDKERNIGELLMLVTSELGEAMEAHRKSKFANRENYDKLRLQLGNNPNA